MAGGLRAAWLVALAATAGCPAPRTTEQPAPRGVTLPDGSRLDCPAGTSLRTHADGAHCVSDTTGRRHGPFASFWPGGEPMARGDYADGDLTGAWIVRYQNGAIRSQGSYQTGLRTGAWHTGLPDGRPLVDETLVAGEAVEQTESTYGADGALTRLRHQRRDGDRSIDIGEQRERTDDGLRSYPAVDGVITGPFRLVTDAGVVLVEVGFDAHGLADGHAIGRRPAGDVAIEGDFHGGLLAGTWRQLDDTGAIRLTISYGPDGSPRQVTTFHPGGRPDLEIGYDDVDGVLARGVAAAWPRWQPLADDEAVARFFTEIELAAMSSPGSHGASGQLECLAGLVPELHCDHVDWEQMFGADEQAYARDPAPLDRAQALACALGNPRACLNHAVRLERAGAPLAAVAGTLALACDRLDDEAAVRGRDSGMARFAPWGARACGLLGDAIVGGAVTATAHTGWDLLERGCAAGEGDACWRAAGRLLGLHPVAIRRRPGLTIKAMRARGLALREQACNARSPSAAACAAIAAGSTGAAGAPWRTKACDAGDAATCAVLGRPVPRDDRY